MYMVISMLITEAIILAMEVYFYVHTSYIDTSSTFYKLLHSWSISLVIWICPAIKLNFKLDTAHLVLFGLCMILNFAIDTVYSGSKRCCISAVSIRCVVVFVLITLINMYSKVCMY